MDGGGAVRRGIESCVLAGVLLALVCPAAGASIGTGVGATPLVVRGDVRPGRTYVAPDLYVVNTGSTRSAYTIRVTRMVPGSSRSIPAGWVSLGTVRFELAPRGVRLVPVRVTIPSGTPAGSYMTNLVATTVERVHANGAALGAAAAARLVVHVASTSSIPWLDLVLAAGVIVLGLGAWLIARSGLRLRIERGTRGA
jgi:hypothetical protein